MPEKEETWDCVSKDTSVRCCLKKAVLSGGVSAQNAESLLNIIDDTVVYVSKISRRGSLVALLTTLKTLGDNAGRLPDDFFGSSLDTFFDQ